VAEIARYDGYDAAALSALLGVPRVVVFDSTASTMDDAHGLAAVGAPSGTVVLADRQTAGRGRAGRRWASDGGHGIWMTVIERPNDAAAVEVLSIRLGLKLARVLDRHATEPVKVKWPNDLFVDGGKVAGILVEARWRARRVDWVAIGVGVNLRAPDGVAASAGLAPNARRIDVLAEIVPAVRAAAAGRSALTASELEEFAARDLAAGRPCVEPATGIVRGITAEGELLVDTGSGVRSFRDGSLIFSGVVA
jgi:BirA family biotin operon repressor/biotin-[acetyl-CoA-carboxylase] ligase